MTARQRRPMTPATQAAIIRGAVADLAAMQEYASTAQIEAKRAELAKARRGEWS